MNRIQLVLSSLTQSNIIIHKIYKIKLSDIFTPSPEITYSFSSDNSFVCFMVISWYLFSPSLIPLAFVYSRGTRYLAMCLLWPHPRGAMPKEHKKQTCCMRSQSHERLWPPLLNLKFGNGWLTSNCCGSSCKNFNSGFQFQFQFQGFQFQFYFQFHWLQFQFQFRNWNWAAIPIPELNWPQPWPYDGIDLSQHWLR